MNHRIVDLNLFKRKYSVRISQTNKQTRVRFDFYLLRYIEVRYSFELHSGCHHRIAVVAGAVVEAVL
jgi:hypothetical protein